MANLHVYTLFKSIIIQSLWNNEVQLEIENHLHWNTGPSKRENVPLDVSSQQRHKTVCAHVQAVQRLRWLLWTTKVSRLLIVSVEGTDQSVQMGKLLLSLCLVPGTGGVFCLYYFQSWFSISTAILYNTCLPHLKNHIQ